jgi:hypothetical protein
LGYLLVLLSRPMDSGWCRQWLAVLSAIPQAMLVALAVIGYRMSGSSEPALPPRALAAPVPTI